MRLTWDSVVSLLLLYWCGACPSFRFASRFLWTLNTAELPVNEHGEKTVGVTVRVSLLIRGVVSTSRAAIGIALNWKRSLHGIPKVKATWLGVPRC